MTGDQSLTIRDKIKQELLEIKTVEAGVTHLNKLNAIDVWVKAEQKDSELQNIIAEQKIRTQRILGSMLSLANLNDGGRPNKGAANLSPTTTGSAPKLTEIGLTRDQSSNFQKIASIPENDFEDFIAEKKVAIKETGAELTTSGILRLAKEISSQASGEYEEGSVIRSINLPHKVNDMLEELKDYRRREKATYSASRVLADLIKKEHAESAPLMENKMISRDIDPNTTNVA